MANEKSETRMSAWQERWDKQKIGFHQPEVHEALTKYFPSLECEGKQGKVFVPLCGKTVDMKWFSDKGLTVFGVDGVLRALHDFFKEQNIEWSEEDAPALGPNCRLLKSIDGKIRLYYGDMMCFNESIEGDFDFIWDRGSLVALNREDIPSYSKIIKSILKPKGKILVEVLEYDVSIFDDGVNPPSHPPPFPVFEDEMKRLFEPECTIETLETYESSVAGKDVLSKVYLISKN